MKKAILSVLFLIPLANISAQWNFSLSMGLDFKSTPSFRDYINTNFAPSAEQLSSFTSSINFTGEVNYCITKNFQFGMEYSLLIDSYNTPVGPGGIYRISYEHHRP